MGLEIKPYKIDLSGILFLGNMISKDTVCQRDLFFVYREHNCVNGRLSCLGGAAGHLAQGFYWNESVATTSDLQSGHCTHQALPKPALYLSKLTGASPHVPHSEAADVVAAALQMRKLRHGGVRQFTHFTG